MEIEVKGHSGCQIDVVREGRELYVYKSTGDLKYLDLIVRQAEKQSQAAIPEYQHIRVPKIQAIDRTEDSVRVKMDYVYSRNFVEYFEQAGFEQVNYLIGALIMYLEREIQNSPLARVTSDVVNDKFADVKARTQVNPHLAGDPHKPAILEQTQLVLEK